MEEFGVLDIDCHSRHQAMTQLVEALGRAQNLNFDFIITQPQRTKQI